MNQGNKYKFSYYIFTAMSDGKGQSMMFYLLIGAILIPVTAGVSLIIAILMCIISAFVDD